MNNEQTELDRFTTYFIAILFTIVTIGVIMVYSSSYIYAKEVFGSSTHFFYRQIIYLAISSFLGLIVSKTKISFWLKFSKYIHLLSVVLLIGTFIPALNNKVNGAARWLYIGPFGIQPGEFIKYTVLLSSIVFFQDYFTLTNKEKLQRGGAILLSLGLLLMQPDYGTFTICFVILACVCFLSDFPRKIFYTSLVSGFILVIGLLFAEPYRVKRLFSYLDPWKNPQTSGFQIIQSYLAFANGSIFGQGIGNSKEKLFYLPEAHNDFIFSVVGEELGLFGVMLMISLFLGLIYVGFKITLKMTDKKRFILCGSIVTTVGIQVFLNMAVVLGLLPTKGLNLPFVSSGGSSLLANFFAISLILSCIKAERLKLTMSGSSNYSSYNYTNSSSTSSF